jgi:hypothetical protein
MAATDVCAQDLGFLRRAVEMSGGKRCDVSHER